LNLTGALKKHAFMSPYKSVPCIEKQFFDPEFDPAKTVLVEQKDRNTIPKLTPIERVNTAKLIFYKPNSVAVSVKTDGDAFLFDRRHHR